MAAMSVARSVEMKVLDLEYLKVGMMDVMTAVWSDSYLAVEWDSAMVAQMVDPKVGEMDGQTAILMADGSDN